MATDKAAFLAVLRETEAAMDNLFERLGKEIGQLVIDAANSDGLVPETAIQDLQRRAGRLVDAAFVQPGVGPYDEQGRPLAPFPEIVTDGQMTMIDLALDRAAAILAQYLPVDLRREMAREWLSGGLGMGQSRGPLL